MEFNKEYNLVSSLLAAVGEFENHYIGNSIDGYLIDLYYFLRNGQYDNYKLSEDIQWIKTFANELHSLAVKLDIISKKNKDFTITNYNAIMDKMRD